MERNPCWSCNSQLSASPPLDLRLHSLLSIGTSPTFEQFEESLVLESSLPGTVRSMWRAAVGGLLALLGKQLWRQQHQQHWQQHLLRAPILVTALTQCFSYSFTASTPLLVQLVNLFHPLTTLWIVCCLSPGFILSSLFGPSLSSFPDSLLDLLFFSHSRNSLFSDLAQFLLFSQFLIYFYSHNCDIS